MIRPCIALILLIATTLAISAQAPGLSLVAPPSNIDSRFFLAADMQWASVKMNGTVNPTDFESTLVPQLTVGWQRLAEQLFFANYRFLGADVGESFNVGVPDLESSMSRRIRLNTIDIVYRERLGGEGVPFGLDVDMGSRFAWAYFTDTNHALTIAGPVNTQRELDFYVGGARLGIRPYWMFDESAWQMTLYAQGNIAWLWGNFDSKYYQNSAISGVTSRSSNSWDTLWNYDAEAGMSMYIPGFEGILQLSGGYRYEGWSTGQMSSLTGSDPGRLTFHGPFLRLQWLF
ncbi:MAG: hypothetical protein JNJ77_03855 [Planctomycetia bacterium]|nr:hypothetical protein [Planctomycetia bacterium]